MEFKNLECNILYILGTGMRGSEDATVVEATSIYSRFPDIPKENVKSALTNLQKEGSLRTHTGEGKLFLTSKGISQVKSIFNCMAEAPRISRQSKPGCCGG